jgi:hypothetical protein
MKLNMGTAQGISLIIAGALFYFGMAWLGYIILGGNAVIEIFVK